MALYFSSHHHHHLQTHAHASPSSSAPSSSSALHPHHGARSRRAPRFAAAMPSAISHRPIRGVRSMKELTEAASVAAFRTRFEAGRSFDLDDDLEFCPGLLTEDDLHYMSSPSSDRSSMSSASSPESSPLQHQVQPTPALTSPPSNPLTHAHPHPNMPFHAGTSSPMKLHQPSALRTRNAIPIVNPSTGMRVPSPPESTSPGMNGMVRRW